MGSLSNFISLKIECGGGFSKIRDPNSVKYDPYCKSCSPNAKATPVMGTGGKSGTCLGALGVVWATVDVRRTG
jgi:hypothetical protein